MVILFYCGTSEWVSFLKLTALPMQEIDLSYVGDYYATSGYALNQGLVPLWAKPENDYEASGKLGFYDIETGEWAIESEYQ